MKAPPVQFAETPEGRVAYQVVGSGPIDVLWNGTPRGNLDAIWEHPPLERFVRREPLYRVHECVFAVLALESEPVDPRL